MHTTPEMNADIVAILRTSDSQPCLYAALRIEELEAIVDKLPKTADGVWIVLGMDVVTHMMTDGWQPNRILGMFLREGVLWLDMGRGAKVRPCNCFSTREAAEAAGGKTDG